MPLLGHAAGADLVVRNVAGRRVTALELRVCLLRILEGVARLDAAESDGAAGGDLQAADLVLLAAQRASAAEMKILDGEPEQRVFIGVARVSGNVAGPEIVVLGDTGGLKAFVATDGI